MTLIVSQVIISSVLLWLIYKQSQGLYRGWDPLRKVDPSQVPWLTQRAKDSDRADWSFEMSWHYQLFIIKRTILPFDREKLTAPEPPIEETELVEYLKASQPYYKKGLQVRRIGKIALLLLSIVLLLLSSKGLW